MAILHVLSTETLWRLLALGSPPVKRAAWAELCARKAVSHG